MKCIIFSLCLFVVGCTSGQVAEHLDMDGEPERENLIEYKMRRSIEKEVFDNDPPWYKSPFETEITDFIFD